MGAKWSDPISLCPHRFIFSRVHRVTGCWSTGAPLLVLLIVALVAPARAVTYYATYTLAGGTATQSGQTFAAFATDTSGVWVNNSGVLTLENCTITTTGNTSSQGSSSFCGLNAGVLATAGKITMSGGSVTTSGTGANGVFATGTGSATTLSGVTITAAVDAWRCSSGKSSTGMRDQGGGIPPPPWRTATRSPFAPHRRSV
jgi:hypothetical protein